MDSVFLPELRSWIYPPYPFTNVNSSSTERQENSQLQLGQQQQPETEVLNTNNNITETTPVSSTSKATENKSQDAGLAGSEKVEIKPNIDVLLKSEGFNLLDNDSQDEFMTFLNSKDEKSYMDEVDMGMDLGDRPDISFNLESSDTDSGDSVELIDLNQVYGRFSGPASDVVTVLEDERPLSLEARMQSLDGDTKGKNAGVKPDISKVVEKDNETTKRMSSRGRRLRQVRTKETESEPIEELCTARSLRTKMKSNKVKSHNRMAEWTEDFRNSLELNEEEFSTFVETQGFLAKSSKLNSLFDFGVAEPKGAPRFATKIPDSYYDHSNALRIYRNVLKNTHAYGITVTNAADQALYQPDNCAEVELKSDRLHKLDPEELIVSVDCYHSSIPLTNNLAADLKTAKLPSVALTIDILASQTLHDLHSRLICENDLVYISEINHPNDAKKLKWNLCSGVHDNHTFQSSAIFIHDTVYTSEVMPNYGYKIKRWVGQKFLENDKDIQMGSLNAKISETGFRPGYPYLYRHNDCEHLLVFTNVRKIHPTDPQKIKLYPRVTFMHTLPPVPCRMNSKHVAKFVVKNDPRLPETVVPLCRECCLTFCFTGDGRSRDRKTGNFQLYPLIQMSTLPFPPNLN